MKTASIDVHDRRHDQLEALRNEGVVAVGSGLSDGPRSPLSDLRKWGSRRQMMALADPALAAEVLR
jgi:hypothetical protein